MVAAVLGKELECRERVGRGAGSETHRGSVWADDRSVEDARNGPKGVGPGGEGGASGTGSAGVGATRKQYRRTEWSEIVVQRQEPLRRVSTGYVARLEELEWL